MPKIIIKDTMIITMENRDSIIKNGYILINDNKIEDIKEGEYNGTLDGVKVINGNGCVALPGLINCHTHVPMTLLRGYGEGLPLMKWLNEKVWPFEAKINDMDTKIGTELGILEMIHSGTTTFVDMYFRSNVIGEAASKAGIRACIGNPIIGEAWESQLEESLSLKDQFKNNSLIDVIIAPHSPYTCTPEVLKKAGEVARKNNMKLHIHIAETMDEINIIRNSYNTTPLNLCLKAQLLEDNKVIAAHCVYVNEEDMKIMKKYGITAVHNPQSNMKLASGVAPILKIMNMGTNVALGTDGASSNNNLNMIDEMQSAALMHKLYTKDATVFGGYDTLRMATVNGAMAIGKQESIGMIKKGYDADIILIDLMKPHMLPIHDIYSNIVFSSQGSDVKTVIISGKVVMEDNKVKTIDEKEVLAKAQDLVEDILKR